MSKVQTMVCECDCHNYQPPDSDIHCPDCEPSGRDRMLEAKAAEFAAEITRLKSEIASLESRHADNVKRAFDFGWGAGLGFPSVYADWDEGAKREWHDRHLAEILEKLQGEQR